MTVTINGTTGVTTPEVTLDNSSADGGQVVLKSSGYSNWNWDNYSGNLRAYYGSTEAMRIDSSGNLLVGTTSLLYSNDKVDIVGGRLSVKGNATDTSGVVQTVSNDANISYWYTPNGGGAYVIPGSNGAYIAKNGTSWAAISDERLKSELTPFENAAEKVASLRAGTGRYLTDNEGVSRSFLIAQDVQKVLPEAVNVQNDEQGTLGLQYTDVIPLIVAAIQELKAEVDDLKAQLEAK